MVTSEPILALSIGATPNARVMTSLALIAAAAIIASPPPSAVPAGRAAVASTSTAAAAAMLPPLQGPLLEVFNRSFQDLREVAESSAAMDCTPLRWVRRNDPRNAVFALDNKEESQFHARFMDGLDAMRCAWNTDVLPSATVSLRAWLLSFLGVG